MKKPYKEQLKIVTIYGKLGNTKLDCKFRIHTEFNVHVWFLRILPPTSSPQVFCHKSFIVLASKIHSEKTLIFFEEIVKK